MGAFTTASWTAFIIYPYTINHVCPLYFLMLIDIVEHNANVWYSSTFPQNSCCLLYIYLLALTLEPPVMALQGSTGLVPYQSCIRLKLVQWHGVAPCFPFNNSVCCVECWPGQASRHNQIQTKNNHILNLIWNSQMLNPMPIFIIANTSHHTKHHFIIRQHSGARQQ